jgi:hypothetical protein
VFRRMGYQLKVTTGERGGWRWSLYRDDDPTLIERSGQALITREEAERAGITAKARREERDLLKENN